MQLVVITSYSVTSCPISRPTKRNFPSKPPKRMWSCKTMPMGHMSIIVLCVRKLPSSENELITVSFQSLGTVHHLYDFRFAFTFRPDEFEQYKIGEDTTITFCMRELRAILNFAESMNISITANFDTAGKYGSFHLRNICINPKR